jgi:hypothetical protein
VKPGLKALKVFRVKADLLDLKARPGHKGLRANRGLKV